MLVPHEQSSCRRDGRENDWLVVAHPHNVGDRVFFSCTSEDASRRIECGSHIPRMWSPGDGVDGICNIGNPRVGAFAEADELADIDQEPDGIIGRLDRTVERQFTTQSGHLVEHRVVREHEPTGTVDDSFPAAGHLHRGRQRFGQRARTRGRVRQRETHGATMTDREDDRIWRQLDALDRNVRRGTAGEQITAAERNGEGKGGVVLDLDHGHSTSIRDAPDAVHRVATRHLQTGLDHGRAVNPVLANGRLSRRHMPAIIGRNEPIEHGRAIPRRDRAGV